MGLGCCCCCYCLGSTCVPWPWPEWESFQIPQLANQPQPQSSTSDVQPTCDLPASRAWVLPTDFYEGVLGTQQELAIPIG